MTAEGEFGTPSTVPRARLLSVVLPVVALGFGGLFGYQAGLMDATPGAAPRSLSASVRTSVFRLPEMVVTLNGPVDAPVYMRLVAALELPSAASKTAIQNALPRLTDEFQTYLRALRPDEVLGAPGTARMKEELLRRTNRVLAPLRVHSILLQEIIVQ